MRLISPETAPKFQLIDSHGKVVRLDSGKRTLLAFFRDTNCPFSSTHEEVNEFVRKRPRPFTIVADPENIAYKAYGIERSMARSAYSVFRHFVSWVLGIKIIGAEGLKKNLQNPSDIMPADFLIDEQGYIIETYYGSDASDHIPFENIYKFLNADQNPK